MNFFLLRPPARTWLVEDNLANLELVTNILLRMPAVELIPAMQGVMAVDLAAQHRPGVILLDLNLPELVAVVEDGPAGARLRPLARARCRADRPQAAGARRHRRDRGRRPRAALHSDARALGPRRQRTVYRAIAAGARGYMPKSVASDEICDAIAAVARGHTVLRPEVQEGLADEIRLRRDHDDTPVLTPREAQIIRLAADGCANAEIARELHLSTATVKTHLHNVFEKLDVSDRSAAVAKAIRRGLVP